MELMTITRPDQIPSIHAATEQFQRQLLEVALDVCQGNRCTAAGALGIHRNSLTRLCSQLGVPRGYGRKSYRPLQQGRR